jgi:hypothetical protein
MGTEMADGAHLEGPSPITLTSAAFVTTLTFLEKGGHEWAASALVSGSFGWSW